MPRWCSVSALNDALASAIAVGLRSTISAHHVATSASSSASGLGALGISPGGGGLARVSYVAQLAQ